MWRKLGLEANSASHHEKLLSATGGFIAIFCIVLVTQHYIGLDGMVYIVPSMGASAVLLFAVPHSPVGQPWNVFGGHILSACIGVLCARYIADINIAAAASVGLAIGVMYYTRCIHPPGGATALVAVVGGAEIQSLGFMYIVEPVLINVLVILLVAMIFNFPFKWRRYPQVLTVGAGAYAPIEHADFVYALSQMDSYIDVSEEDLLKIYTLATARSIRSEVS